MQYAEELDDIPGTIVFDHRMARSGYYLNQFCMSLMQPANRVRFLRDEQAYLAEWPMREDQREAVLARDFNRMIELGGNAYFLFKISNTDGHSVRRTVSGMSGMGEAEYEAMMLSGGRSPRGIRSRREGR
jgi:protocatechuate 4,5-dioxygenase alpha chain